MQEKVTILRYGDPVVLFPGSRWRPGWGKVGDRVGLSRTPSRLPEGAGPAKR